LNPFLYSDTFVFVLNKPVFKDNTVFVILCIV